MPGFKLMSIFAVSGHPVRNSRNNLITGSHYLWRSDSAPSWPDGDRGSFAPNIFRYKFGDPVNEAGHLNVIIKPLDPRLIDHEVFVYGSIDGRRILQTNYFKFRNQSEVIVAAYFIDPPRSNFPFDKNKNVSWEMRLRQSGQVVGADGPSTTRLELYWISPTIHPALSTGIPVQLLRAAFGVSPRDLNLEEEENVAGVLVDTKAGSPWYAYMTRLVFFRYSKQYDTIHGASAFNMNITGGRFNLLYYLAKARESDPPGTLSRKVNCYDQAGILELLCSLGVNNPNQPTSWLIQNPFGFIRKTKLVGIVDTSNNLVDVNNPFFSSNQTPALIGNNDRRRTRFGNHVFVGHKKPFNLQVDAIYDACAGPHTGTETAAAYLTASRQEEFETELYRVNNTLPGQVNQLRAGNGVIASSYRDGGHHTMDEDQAQAGDMLTRLVDIPAHLSQMAVMHLDWAHVDNWLADVLGGQWTVAFKTLEASEGNAHVFWHLAGTDDVVVRITVDVETIATDAGELDVQHSADAARNDAALLLYSTERHPSEVWARGELSEFGDYTFQYSATALAGRCVIVAGNTVVDIAGGDSTAALVPIVRQLLEHVVQRDRDGHVPLLPTLSHGRVVSLIMPLHEDSLETVSAEEPTYSDEDRSVTIRGTDARLTLEFEVDSAVSVANATSEDGKVLLDKSEIVNDGEQSKVRFVLIAREVGTHATHLHVTHDKTMVTSTYTINIKVESE